MPETIVTDKEKKRKAAEKEFVLLSLNRSCSFARLAMTLQLFLYCIYNIFNTRPVNFPLYMLFLINVLPIMIAYISRAFSRKEYKAIFPQLAKDMKFNRSTFTGGMIGIGLTYVLIIYLRNNLMFFMLGVSLLVQALTFVIYRFRIRKRMGCI